MKRRKFITLVGGAAAWPVAARAQQPALPVIGLLSPRSPAVDAALISVIRQGLNDAGFVEGRNVALDYRWADGQHDRVTALATDLVQRKTAVIIAMGGEISAVAAKNATATVPIVFLVGSDPVRSGLVSNLNRPGGNITGTSSFIFDLEPKRLGLMRELRPDAATIAILVNPNSPTAESQVNDIRSAARNVGQQIDILNASTIREIDAAFAKLARMGVDALLDDRFHEIGGHGTGLLLGDSSFAVG
jgi:putative ABC transport system substrate-binding protein